MELIWGLLVSLPVVMLVILAVAPLWLDFRHNSPWNSWGTVDRSPADQARVALEGRCQMLYTRQGCPPTGCAPDCPKFVPFTAAEVDARQEEVRLTVAQIPGYKAIGQPMAWKRRCPVCHGELRVRVGPYHGRDGKETGEYYAHLYCNTAGCLDLLG